MATYYTATWELSIPQLVHCAHCGYRFVYESRVVACGSATVTLFQNATAAKAMAEKRAAEELNAELNNPRLFSAIPCGHCFRYQPYMARRVSRRKYALLNWLARLMMGMGLIVALGALLAAFSLNKELNKDRPEFLTASLGGLASCLLGVVLRQRVRALIARHDPNNEHLDERKTRATARAMSLPDYDESQVKRARRAYEKHAERGGHRPWDQDNPFAGEEPLFVWYLEPSTFFYGGSFSIRITDADHVTVMVPEDANPGDVVDLHDCPNTVLPFKIRLLPIRVHPDEHRPEDDLP